MTAPPLVTIMVPAYNHEAYIAECIESLWAQTYPNLEIVVCDDASPDGTLAILQAMATRSPVPMTVLKNETNKGVCATLNRCLDAARGDWIAMIASDDMYLPAFIATNVVRAQAEGSEKVCLQSGAWWLFENGRRIRCRPNRQPLDGEALEDIAMGRGYLMAPSFFTSRTVYAAVGAFDETLMFEDLDFFLRAARVAPFRTLEKALIIKRKLPRSLGRRMITENPLEGFQILKKNLRDPLLNLAIRRRAWVVSGTLARNADYRSLLRLIRMEADRRGAYPWTLWLGAARGLCIEAIVRIIRPGTAGRIRYWIRSINRIFFWHSASNPDQFRSPTEQTRL